MPATSPASAFIDYYNKNKIIPVSQDLTDLDAFIFRRNYLYQTLGLPLARIKNLNVIEFGPGGGYNAVATSSFQPANYVFVDATSASIAELHRKQAAGKFHARHVEIAESNIFDYRDARRFDLVICEGVIPGQNDPRRMIRHVASFCAPGGLFFTTTTSASSILSEICRRVLRPAIMTPDRTFAEQTRAGADVFRSHLRNLATSTRPVEDWVQDSILHDWQDGEYVFTMSDAVTALGDEFEFFSSSPRFLLDDRWYKQVNPGSLSASGLFKQQFPLISAFLLDFRLPLRTVLQVRDTDRLAAIESLSKSACGIHDVIVNENSYDRLEDFLAVLAELGQVLPGEFALTKEALRDFAGASRRFAAGETKADFRSFEKWWGRGQQYLGLTRTAQP